jgi:hypothetical protein
MIFDHLGPSSFDQVHVAVDCDDRVEWMSCLRGKHTHGIVPHGYFSAGAGDCVLRNHHLVGCPRVACQPMLRTR